MSSIERKKRANLRQAVGLLLAVLGLVAFIWWYQKVAGPTQVTVQFQRADGTLTEPFYLEVVSDNASRQRGLQHRRQGSLMANQGMLFVFDQEKKHSFWMKDTYISLDMMFLDRTKKIVGTLENVPILNEESRAVPHPSQYVVELLAGESKKNNITSGAEMLVVYGMIPKAVPELK